LYAAVANDQSMSLLHAKRGMQAGLVFKWQLWQQGSASDVPQAECSNYEAEHSAQHIWDIG